jgi:hypothetical protein
VSHRAGSSCASYIGDRVSNQTSTTGAARRSRRRWAGTMSAIMAAGGPLVATAARAHVKWFVHVDPAERPRPIGDVLTEPVFVYLLLFSIAAVYAFFLVDRIALRRGLLAQLEDRTLRFDVPSKWVMRGCGSIFFLALAAWHFDDHGSFYLTPELVTRAAWVPWLQLAMALALLWRPTMPLAGVGVFVLFGASIMDYGAYHMIDYMIFLGIGYFFLVAGIEGAWRRSGFIVLFAATGLTLGWAAIEKFAYPQWSYPLLHASPGMLMGMQPMTYMVLAGFVEFNIAFVLLGVASMLGRVIALGLQTVFVLAIYKFGLLDAIGHLMIIAILFVLFFRGPTDARSMLVLHGKSVATEAYFMTGLYALALVLVMLAYYGLHHVYYGV